jgi:serine/threonine-protein kinase
MRLGLTDTETQNLIADLLIKWEESFENGDEVSAEELCAEHPELLSELQQKIKALKTMAWMNHDTDEDSSEDFIGRVLNERYEVKELIGAGGYGAVYKSYDIELERFVAVKIKHAHRIDSNSKEAKVGAKFQTDGIVSVFDVGTDNGVQFIVSELIGGVNLREFAKANDLDWRQSVKLVSALATNLQKAHDSDLIHRDIKPENILIDKAGQPHIADFGIACSSDDAAEANKGTLAYMAPEQVTEDQNVDHRCDVYSLGVVLFELLSRSLPHSNRDPDILREHILHSEPDFESVEPKAVQAICKKALAKHPEMRYQSARELVEALNDCLSDQQAKQSSWLKYLWGFAGLAILGFLFTLVWQSFSWSQLEGGEIFDGAKRIVTDIDSFYPCTVEAWIAPSTEKEQWIVGSDVPSQFGIGIGIKNGGHPMTETIRGGMHDPDTKIPLNEWSHLATVFGEEQTRMYLNGKLVGTCPPTEGPTEPSKFVIGNLGEKHQTQYFTGRIREVRISKGELYDGAFEPEERLLEEASTLLKYPLKTGANSTKK